MKNRLMKEIFLDTKEIEESAKSVLSIINKDVYKYLRRYLCFHCYNIYLDKSNKSFECICWIYTKKYNKIYYNCPYVCKQFYLRRNGYYSIPKMEDILNNYLILNYGIIL